MAQTIIENAKVVLKSELDPRKKHATLVNLDKAVATVKFEDGTTEKRLLTDIVITD